MGEGPGRHLGPRRALVDGYPVRLRRSMVLQGDDISCVRRPGCPRDWVFQCHCTSWSIPLEMGKVLAMRYLYIGAVLSQRGVRLLAEW